MSAIATYLAMGGFAVYVWPAYGLAFAVLGGLAVHSWRRYRASKSALAEIERQSQRPPGRGRGR